MKKTTRFLLAIALIMMGFVPLAQAETLPSPRIVASFSILADMAHQVGGKQVEVTSIVAPDRDAHSYQPTPEDVKMLSGVDLVIINGLGFEGWMERLIEASGYKGKVIVASKGVQPRAMKEDGKEIIDPHAWQNVANGRIYARNILEAMSEIRPKDASVYRAAFARYDRTLNRVHQSIHNQISSVPLSRRKIITSHDAFGYFGDAYGITFLAPEGISTESEPSAATVAQLIEQIKSEKIHTVFIENMTNPKLIQQIAMDTGATMGGELYADALSVPDGPAATYIDMIGNNVSKLKAAMMKK